MMEQPKTYLVRWNDAWRGSSGYYREDGDYTPMQIMDIGFVCEENEDTLVIASCYAEDESKRHLSVIPWEYIISIEELV